MSEFNVRVELNGFSNSGKNTYDKLHAAMAAKGFTRHLTVAGKKYQLPHGNYWRVSALPNATIHSEALAAAQSVWPDVDLMVTLDGGTIFNLKPYVEPINPFVASILQGAKVAPRKF